MVSSQISAALRRRWYEPPPVHALRRRWHVARLRRTGRRLVFIAGCARSGTSLLKQLMACFADTAVCPRERPLWQFLEMADRPETTLVVKRTAAARVPRCSNSRTSRSRLASPCPCGRLCHWRT